jgi:catechol 2,3-dioxygenase-like lactoylglutathione lyase family enzyme
MRPHISGIDHVVILARNLDTALDTFTRMGLHPTPRGHHSIGTQNHCLMLQRDYVELLSVVRPHPVTQYFSDFLARRDGLAAVAFSTDDANAAYEALRQAGIGADEPVDFSRPVQAANGLRDARFRIVQLPTDATPAMRTFLCQHFTPELVWLPEYLEHPLGARGIVGLTIASADPAAAASAYGALLDETPVPDGDTQVLRLGDVRLRFVAAAATSTTSSAAHGGFVESLQLGVADASRAEASLRDGAVPYQRLADGTLTTSPDATCGVAIRFVPL